MDTFYVLHCSISAKPLLCMKENGLVQYKFNFEVLSYSKQETSRKA